jgi:hypothetical protein
MDALREMYDPDVIARPLEGWPEPGPYMGRETWDVDALELISDFIDVGDRVAVRWIWRTAGYGPEANLEVTNIHTLRKGKILDIEYFWDHAEALEALAVSEQDAHADS